TSAHALRLWKVEEFDRVLVPAPAETHGPSGGGLSPRDLLWILTHSPTETLVLRPGPQSVERESASSSERARRRRRPGTASEASTPTRSTATHIQKVIV